MTNNFLPQNFLGSQFTAMHTNTFNFETYGSSNCYETIWSASNMCWQFWGYP